MRLPYFFNCRVAVVAVADFRYRRRGRYQLVRWDGSHYYQNYGAPGKQKPAITPKRYLAFSKNLKGE
jgi:hypothetical protein